MKPGRFVLGASAGLLVALLFVGGATLLGPAASHIDLVGPAAVAAPQFVSTSTSGNQVSVFPDGQATGEAVQAPPAQPSISSLGSLSTDSATSIGLLFLPILLGVLVGGILYAVFARRVEAG